MLRMPICSICGERVPRGASYLVALECEGKLQFRWGCEHNSVGDAAFYFGSRKCSDEWIELHPLLRRPYLAFLKLGVNCCAD